MEKFYDKKGSVYMLDHMLGDKAYVRPMVKVIVQTTNYLGDDYDEFEEYEPASYLIEMNREDLFSSSPVQKIDEEISEKIKEFSTLKKEIASEMSALKAEKEATERELISAKRQLEDWQKKHRVIQDIGKLMDGVTLYPLSTPSETYISHSSYYNMPTIPNPMYWRKLVLLHGNFKAGQPWVYERTGFVDNSYGSPFLFFETEEERNAEIREQFKKACEKFVRSSNPDLRGYHDLVKWTKTYQFLVLPKEVEAIKVAEEQRTVQKKREELEAQLASLNK